MPRGRQWACGSLESRDPLVCTLSALLHRARCCKALLPWTAELLRVRLWLQAVDSCQALENDTAHLVSTSSLAGWNFPAGAGEEGRGTHRLNRGETAQSRALMSSGGSGWPPSVSGRESRPDPPQGPPPSICGAEDADSRPQARVPSRRSSGLLPYINRFCSACGGLLADLGADEHSFICVLCQEGRRREPSRSIQGLSHELSHVASRRAS